MFSGFVDTMIDVGGLNLRVRYAGAGPAILLLHGHPRTSSTWHAVAPRLVESGFTVVCPDMRGYGGSDKAAVLEDHSQQSKRTVAKDLARLMDILGHERFSVVGHDRGCYVGMRLALDHADRVTGFVAMDAVPLCEAFDRCDFRFAKEWYHWFFFGQEDKPELAINADPIAWYDESAASMGEENYREFCEAVTNPETVRAQLEDYRAGLGIDYSDELADKKRGAKLDCPVLFVWGEHGDIGDLYNDPVALWRDWAGDVTAVRLASSHHLAELVPEDLFEAILRFENHCGNQPGPTG